MRVYMRAQNPFGQTTLRVSCSCPGGHPGSSGQFFTRRTSACGCAIHELLCFSLWLKNHNPAVLRPMDNCRLTPSPFISEESSIRRQQRQLPRGSARRRPAMRVEGQIVCLPSHHPRLHRRRTCQIRGVELIRVPSTTPVRLPLCLARLASRAQYCPRFLPAPLPDERGKSARVASPDGWDGRRANFRILGFSPAAPAVLCSSIEGFGRAACYAVCATRR